MSVQLEEPQVIEQLAFEGLQVNSVRFSSSLSDIDCRFQDEPLALKPGDRITVMSEHIVTDVVHGEKLQDVDGKVVGIGPLTRKHQGKLVAGSAIVTAVQRRETEEDRVRRLTR